MNASDHAPAGQSDVLRSAWKRKTELDLQASKLSKQQLQLRKWIAVLGVVATILAITNNQFDSIVLRFVPSATFANNHVTSPVWLDYLKQIFHIALIAVPIIISVLAAYTNKFFGGPNWLVMRAGAEEILKEIYLYRTVLRNHPEKDKWLSRRLTTVQRRTYKSLGGELIIEAYEGKLPMYYNPDDPNSDPGFNDLSGDEYMRYRVIEQRDWHRRKIISIKQERIRIQLYILVMGGVGAFLAAIGGQWAAWVALTAAIASAFTGWEQLRGLDKTITIYSRVILELTIVRDEWESLAPHLRAELDFVTMVRNAEGVMWAQNQQYVSTMQEAMTSGQGDEAELVESMLQEGESLTDDLQTKLLEEAKGVLAHTSEELGKVVEESAATVKGMVGKVSTTATALQDKAKDAVEEQVDAFGDLADESLDQFTAEADAFRLTAQTVVDTAQQEAAATRTAVETTTKTVASQVGATREAVQDTIVEQVTATRETVESTAQTVASDAEAIRATVKTTVTEQASAAREVVETSAQTLSTEADALLETAQTTVETAGSESAEFRDTVETATDTLATEAKATRETIQTGAKAVASESAALRTTAKTVAEEAHAMKEHLESELEKKGSTIKETARAVAGAAGSSTNVSSSSLDDILEQAAFVIDGVAEDMKEKMADRVVDEIVELVEEGDKKPKGKKPKK